MTTAEGTEQLSGGVVTANTFQFLGVSAALGRVIGPADAAAGAPAVVVMAHKMWVKHFNQRSDRCRTRADAQRRADDHRGGDAGAVHEARRRTSGGRSTLNRADPSLKDRYFIFQARLKPGVTPQPGRGRPRRHRAPLRARSTRSDYPKQFDVIVVSWVDSIVGPFRDDALHDVGRGWPAAADRLLQRRDHAARAIDDPRRARWPSAPRSARTARGWFDSC